ncbi:TetR family transcriptional regulator [Gordonia spumicola]|uniref:TetR family transcriptional regulator n=1 Tax=Gordonia spumicola TaxID=589161 RepID=A0A7I9VFP9_9ACTN|nr:TetR/AcrR family transcriptional regulator [Gordonia spumicola]GEE03921.1 TetR family transcriptional regulator [Gordonia spumicola]
MTESRSYRGQPVDDRRRQRRTRFLDSALALFGTQGYAASSIPAVCRHASLSSRQFYESFTDREDLLKAVYDDIQDATMSAVSDAVVAALERHARLDDVLEAGVAAFVDYYADSPERIRLSFVEVVGVSPAFEVYRRERRLKWADLLAAVSDRAAQQGLPVADTDPLVWSAYLGAVNFAIVENAENPDTTVDDVMRVMRRMLRPGVLG